MSQKHSYTTADYLPWDSAMMRISDLLELKWEQILESNELIVNEHKTGKRRVIKINKGFQAHIQDCHKDLNITDDSQYCFINRFGGKLTVQMVNRHLKTIKYKYQINIMNFSTHSLRKTFARKIYEDENAKGKGEMALLKLSELMNHSAPSITRLYIGLRQQELGEVYDCLTF